ncbi:NUDIX domain-containing protein [Desertivirga xinjiangensis]|uniref:NUDIX domain-containing protein n=1 Tax=Desertivirga xinjiangensis TaxID=539206 RepID=UPI00210DB2E2|nr:NUDIX domain-containing protein [Pedobacter xinjiangensis]
MKHTAGIWAYRVKSDHFEILLVHPGGPFYAKKDAGVWSVPKGEYNPDQEDALEVAKREFFEETGNTIASSLFIPLEPVRSKGGKLITTWATEADFEQCYISSNMFEIEWPPKSGKMQSFPETDKADWFSMEEARLKINASQLPILMELEQKLRSLM